MRIGNKNKARCRLGGIVPLRPQLVAKNLKAACRLISVFTARAGGTKTPTK